MRTPQLEMALVRWLQGHHAVIGRSEALRLGASESDIRAKLRRGEWIAVYPGVYIAASAPPTTTQAIRAAFVAIGGWVVVSHWSAAWLWGLLRTLGHRPELTIPRSQHARAIEGVIIHQSRDIHRSVVSNWQTMVVTNPLRTLVDLAGIVSAAQLSAAVDVAVARKLVTVDGVTAEMDRLSRQGRPGAGPMRAHLLTRGFVGAPAPSVLEAKFRRLVLGIGLPIPEAEHVVNVKGVDAKASVSIGAGTGAGGGGGVAGDVVVDDVIGEGEMRYRIDIAWPEPKLALEAEGFGYHASPEAKRYDLARRRRLQLLGWTVMVYDWREIVDEPDRVAREIRTIYDQLSRPAETAAAGSSRHRRIPALEPESPGAVPAPPSP